MEFGGRGRYKGKGKGKANETILLCHCGLSAKCAQAWTYKNPGRRFYGCVRWQVEANLCILYVLLCYFVEWYSFRFCFRLHLIVGFFNGSMMENLSYGKSKL